MLRTVAAAAAVVTLAGCGSMLQSATDDAQAAAQRAFVGQRADSFFALHGLPVAAMQTQDGAIYEWRSDVVTHAMPVTTTATTSRVGDRLHTVATTTGGNSLSVYCNARLLVDKTGIITSFRITADTVGNWALSRCAEVLR